MIIARNDDVFSQLPNDDRRALALTAELEKRAKRGRYFRMFPEQGNLRRDLYRQHLQFFAMGKIHRERCFMAANRVGKCCTAATPISTCSGEVPLGELYRRGQPFDVWAWGGDRIVPASALPPFKKPGLHECYRLFTRHGWIECADQHRLLIDGQWQLCGSFLGSEKIPLASSLACGLSTRSVGGRHWSGTPLDSLAGCQTNHRYDDGRLRSEADTDLVLFPSPSDALRHSVASWYADDLGHKHTNSGQLCADRHSIQGALCRALDRLAEWSSQAALLFDSRYLGLPRDVQRFSTAEGLALSGGGLVDPAGPACSSRKLAYQHPLLAANDIIAYQPIGRQEVYDFTVPEYHNYLAGGLVNHNTEGAGGYELVGHLTGQYRAWWPGYKFRRPVRTWAAGDTSQTVRDILQVKLLGPPGEEGTGLIPHDTIGKITKKAHGPSDAVETVQVKHVTGGWSRLTFKSYDQKRKSFQGTELDVILLDEEPDIGVYTECLTRTVTTGGLVMLTFTPLIGLSEVVLSFLPEGRLPDAT